MNDPTAVVVGLCPHGLSISRSLHQAGIKVVGIEANRLQRGTSTNSADVEYVDDINGPGLIEALISLAPSISASGPPVLFLTNDTMVATVGESYGRLGHLYKLSWGTSRNNLLPLLRKEGIEERCRSAGLLYPRTRTIQNIREATATNLDLTFPIIFKPDKPLSKYKTLVAESNHQLKSLRSTIETSLPSIAQEFIPGDESKIRFAALYLIDGEVVARFEGRKLRSRPMGHTSVAISETNDQLHSLARFFFDGLRLTGPVSLEAKEDADSKFWIIEPTVGRTDFWVGLCVKDGINLPLIEYNNQCGRRQAPGAQLDRTLWINGERDPAALVWLALKYPGYLLRLRIVGVIVSSTDILPFVRWAAVSLRTLPVRAVRKLVRMFKSAVGGVVIS